MTKVTRSRLSLWGLCEAAGALACALTASAFLGRRHWLLELTTHWRVQYAVGLALLALVGVLARKLKAALVFGAFALVNVVVLAPYFIPGRPEVPASASQLRVMLLNVSTENVRYEAVLKEVLRFNPDVLVLEEVNGLWLRKLSSLEAVYPWRVCAARDDNFGIAFFSRLPLKSGQTLYVGEAGVPSVQGIVTVAGKEVLVIGSHPLPPANPENARLRNEQLEAVARHLSTATGPKVLLGDLNLTPWSPYFSRLLRASGLKDTGRGHGLQPTWPARLVPLWIPIDHCLVSAELGVANRRTGKYIGADHYPLVVDLALR